MLRAKPEQLGLEKTLPIHRTPPSLRRRLRHVGGHRPVDSSAAPFRIFDSWVTWEALLHATTAWDLAWRQGPSMRLSLIVRTQGKMNGKAIPVPHLPFLIGRARDCQLRPASPMISKMHCGFVAEGKGIFLNDFKSTNGTFLNDKPVEGKTEVHDGDILRLGSLEFELRLQGAPAVDEPTPLPPNRGRPRTKAGNEDDIAALLLSPDGETSSSSSAEVAQTSMHTTSLTSADTQISTLPPDPLPEPVAASNGDQKAATNGEKKKEDKSEPEKPKYGNTSEAAENILKMYMRRNRGQKE